MEIYPVDPDNTIFIKYKSGEKATIVEIIDEEFVVIQYYGIQMIYSTILEMFNATKLVSSLSSMEFKKWNESKSSALFRDRFPKFFHTILSKRDSKCKDFNRISGTYLDMSLLSVIVAWCNPMLGYFLVNDIHESYVNDTQGYVYLVQPEEYIGTNIYKIGRTWNPKQRFREYGEKNKVIKEVKVTNMYKCESSIIDDLTEDDELKLIRGKEYFEGDLEQILYHFEEVIKQYDKTEGLTPMDGQ